MNNLYSDKFFRRRVKKYHDLEVQYAKIFHSIFHPSSVVDVGCAIGSYLDGFRLSGMNPKNLCGYEPYTKVSCRYASQQIRNRIFELDAGKLREPRTRYDLVMCIEVAEHIAFDNSNNLIKNLVGLKKQNRGSILFTAADVGQSGTGHINCQPQSYWVTLFSESGLYRNESVELQVKSELLSISDPLNIVKNLMIFQNPLTN